MENQSRITGYTTRQKVLSFAVVYMVSFLGILNCLNAITNEIGFHTSLDTVVCYGLLIVSIVLGMLMIIISGKIKMDVILLLSAIFLAYVFTITFFPENTKYFYTNATDFMANPLYVFVLYSVPGYIFVRYITNFEYFKKYMLIFSYFVVSISVIVNFFITDSFANQYMTLSYNMLAQVAFLILYKPKKNKIIHYIFIALGSFVIAFGGSRGALVGLLIVVLLLLIYNNYSKKMKMLLFTILATVSAAALAFYDTIILAIGFWLRMNDIDSRTFEFFMNGGGDVTSGRTRIQSFLLKKWTVFGNGLYGDRVLMKESQLFAEDTTYAHNMFVEWIVDFGIVIGIALTIGFIVLLLKGLRNKQTQEFIYIIVFTTTGFVQMMFSGSYLLQEPGLFVLLGLCVNASSKVKMTEKANVSEKTIYSIKI